MTQLRAAIRASLPALGLAAAYLWAGLIGLSLTIAHDNATPVWPPTGIALAALLIYGRRLWPGITLGALLANLLTSASPLFSVFAAVGNTLTVLIAHDLIRRAGGVGSLDHLGQVVALVCAALLSSVVSATIGTGALVLIGALDPRGAWLTGWVWWLGDSLGYIIVTPLILAWRRVRRFMLPERQLEGAALAVLLVAVSAFVFGPWGEPSLTGFPLAYLVLPFVVWAGLRFEQPGATLATLVTSTAALWGAVSIFGPLWREAEMETLLRWQVFSVVVGVTGLSIAGASTQRNRALRALHHHSATLEREVAQRTLDLAEQNAQMRDFTFTISHDLRAPIRAIQGFVDVLVDDVGPHLGPMGHEYVRRIGTATQRMDLLIQNLLAYSRLGEVRLAHEPVSLAQVVAEALHDLEPTFAERGALRRIEVSEELPPVLAHRLTLVQAIANLLVNAVTYVPPGRTPEILVRAEPASDRMRLWIEDNGVGIDTEHHERIFRVFERLQTADPQGGTGIGLAMVKRAVERMGGAVGLESAQGSGSRFWIDLRIVDRSGTGTGRSGEVRQAVVSSP